MYVAMDGSLSRSPINRLVTDAVGSVWSNINHSYLHDWPLYIPPSHTAATGLAKVMDRAFAEEGTSAVVI